MVSVIIDGFEFSSHSSNCECKNCNVKTTCYEVEKDEDTIFLCEDCIKIFLKIDEVKKCENCDYLSFNVRTYDLYTHSPIVLCQNCREQEFICCDDCGNLAQSDNSYYCDDCDENFCERCWNNHSHDNDNEDDEDNEESNLPFKDSCESFIQKSKLIDVDVKHGFDYFGVELECNCNNDFDNQDKALKYFKIVHDGSLNESGIEIVSSVLKSDRKGFKVLKNACEFLNDYCSVDKCCGLHIHINFDKRLYNLTNIKKILVCGMRLEQQFFSLVPRSRRNNSFCMSLNNDMVIDKILKCRKLSTLLSYYYDTRIRSDLSNVSHHKYPQKADKRYYWLNFHSINYLGTIENRLHNGTLNFDKIKNWYLINKRFLIFCLKHSLEDIVKMPTERLFKLILNKKLEDYADMRVEKFMKSEVD